MYDGGFTTPHDCTATPIASSRKIFPRRVPQPLPLPPTTAARPPLEQEGVLSVLLLRPACEAPHVWASSTGWQVS